MHIYIYNRVPPLGALKSQLGGTYSRSLLFYIVKVYCAFTCSYVYIYLYIYICIHIYIYMYVYLYLLLLLHLPGNNYKM